MPKLKNDSAPSVKTKVGDRTIVEPNVYGDYWFEEPKDSPAVIPAMTPEDDGMFYVIALGEIRLNGPQLKRYTLNEAFREIQRLDPTYAKYIPAEQ